MVSLMPMNPEVKAYSTIKFTCNYDHPETFYIYFKLSTLDGLPVTARGGIPGPIIKTEKGAYRTWLVHVARTACNVECHILNRGKELIKIVTSVTPGLTPRTAIAARKLSYLVRLTSVTLIGEGRVPAIVSQNALSRCSGHRREQAW